MRNAATDAEEKDVLQQQTERFGAMELAPGRVVHDAVGKVCKAGERVEIFGLQGKPELNNTFGRIVSYMADRGRFGVQREEFVHDGEMSYFMWSEDPPISLKPQNVRLASRMPAAIGTAAGSRRAEARDCKCVLDWLDAGGDIEARHPAHNDTVLTMAVAAGAKELVDQLLKRKADVEATARSNTTALMYAAGEGSYGIVKMLLDASACVGTKDAFGHDALYIARDKDHRAVAKLLRAHGGAVTAHPPVLISEPESQRPDVTGGSRIYWAEGACAGCGSAITHRPGFQCCPRCVEDQIATPAQFCSKACFAQHWPVHKEWHATRGQDAPVVDPASAEAKAARELRERNDAQARKASDSLKGKGDYGSLLSQAMTAFMAGDHLQCKKLSRRAIAVDPGWWPAYQLLGDCLFAGGNYVDALTAHLTAIDATSPASDFGCAHPAPAAEKNAACCAQAYADVVMLTDAQVPSDLPAWMTDRELLRAKAESVAAAVPQLHTAHTMRANALVSLPSRPHYSFDEIQAGVITADHFRESAKSWTRAAEVADGAEQRVLYADNAAVHNGQATSIEQAAKATLDEPACGALEPWPEKARL